MHVCTCSNRTLAEKWLGGKAAYDQVLCDHFESCPEEERTGVKNDEWLDFLAADLDGPAPKRSERLVSIEPAVPWDLKLVQGAMDADTKRPDPIFQQTTAVQTSTPPSIPLPAVLVGQRREERTSAWLAALVVVAFFGVAGVVGYKAYNESIGGGPEPSLAAASLGSAPGSPEDRGASSPAVEPPKVAPPEPIRFAPVVVERDVEPAPKEQSPEARRAEKRAEQRAERRRHRHHDRDRHRSHKRRSHKAVDRDADVDINRLPKDPNYSLYGSLAKLDPKPAAAPEAAPAPQKAPPVGQASEEAAKPAPPKSAPERGDSFHKLLDEATGRQQQGASKAAAKPALPAELSGSQITRVARRISSPVRRCATRFGFGKVSIPVALRISGAAGKVTGLTLGGRFSGTPLQACVARAVHGKSTPRFRQSSQTLRFPIYVP